MFAFTDFLVKASSAWASQVRCTKYISKLGHLSSANRSTQKCWCSTCHCFNNDGAIGPLEIAYILENTGQTSIYYGTVQNAAGNYILANVQTFKPHFKQEHHWSTSGKRIMDNRLNNRQHIQQHNSHWHLPNRNHDLRFSIQAQTNYTQGAALVNFLSWIVNSGQNLGTGLGYVPLPANIVAN